MTCHESYLLKIYNPEWRGAEDDEGIDLYLDSGETGGLEEMEADGGEVRRVEDGTGV